MPSQHLKMGFDTDLTIRNAAAIKAMLVERLQVERSVCLELNHDAAVDLSFVQLIHAARVHLDRAGGSLSLARPATGAVAALLVRAGFSSHPDDVDFWFHGDLPQ